MSTIIRVIVEDHDLLGYCYHHEIRSIQREDLTPDEQACLDHILEKSKPTSLHEWVPRKSTPDRGPSLEEQRAEREGISVDEYRNRHSYRHGSVTATIMD